MKRTLLFCLLFLPVVTAYTLEDYTLGSIPVTEITLNYSEQPITINLSHTYEAVVSNLTMDYEYGPWLIGPENQSMNQSPIILNTTLNIKNQTTGLYTTNAVLLYNETPIHEWIIAITIKEGWDETLFNLSEPDVNVSANTFNITVYDVELPYTERRLITYQSGGETVNLTCSSHLECPSTSEPGGPVGSVYVRIVFNKESLLKNYQETVTISRGNKSGNVTFNINLKEAPVVVHKITDWEFKSINLSNATPEELLEYTRQLKEFIIEAEQVLEAANRPIVQTNTEEVMVDHYIPVAAIDEELLMLKDWREEREAEDKARSEELASAKEALENLTARYEAQPSRSEIETEVKQRLALESAWPRWMVNLLWVFVVIVVGLLIGVGVTRAYAWR